MNTVCSGSIQTYLFCCCKLRYRSRWSAVA